MLINLKLTFNRFVEVEHTCTSGNQGGHKLPMDTCKLPRPLICGSEEYQQPNGDDHRPVTVTSQKRISAVPDGQAVERTI